PDSNLLLSVTDDTANPKGFNDGNTQNDDFEYDNNGNMTVDKNKDIKNITYNHLNLPTKILFGNSNYITYLYTASGQKVNKVVNEAGVITTTDYINGFQYKKTDAGCVLEFFPHAEGYVKHTAGAFNYVFNYTDHLGNVRMSYGKDPVSGVLKITEENNYYAFGMKHKNYNMSLRGYGKLNGSISLNTCENCVSSYNYKFQGQERQDELGLNWDSFKWRNYDYAIGRFMSIDPLAEKYVYNGVYNFAENRVIDGRELEGLEWANIKNSDGTTYRQLTVQLYNNSSLTDKQVAKLTETIKADFAKSYSGDGASAQLVVNNVTEAKGDFVVTLIDTQSNTLYDRNTGEEIGKTYEGGKTGTLGDTQRNNFEVAANTDGSKRSNSDISRSFSHEAGHTAGLEHPWLASNPVSDIKQGTAGVTNNTVRNNLMNSDKNTNVNNRSTSGTTLTSGQLQSIDKLIETQTKK
ncbi:RHS repeat domain-containing protein, partial [Flavobacterium branchiophilum]